MRQQRLGGLRKVLTVAALLVFGLCLAPGASGQERYLQLQWVDRSGEPIGTIGEQGEYRGVDVAPDGLRVAAHRHVGNGGEVLVFDISGTAVPLVTDATGVQENAHPIFSPDSKRIVFSALRDGSWGLYIRSVDEAGADERVATSGRTIVPMSWSPDGRYIVYWQNDGTEWVVALDDDRMPFRLMDGPSSHSQISPDGRWVAYLSSGDVWIRAFPEGSTAWPVSTGRGAFPRWRADGRELYYMSTGSLGMIMAAGIEASGDTIDISEPQPLFASGYINQGHPSNYHTFAVSPDGQRFLIPRPEPDALVVLDRERAGAVTLGRHLILATEFSPDGARLATLEGDLGLWIQDLAGGGRRRVARIDDPQVFGASFAWSPDGDRIAYLVSQPRGDTLRLAQVRAGREPDTIRTMPGVGGSLIGWTADGNAVLYYSAQLGGSVVFRLSLDAGDEPVDVMRSQTQMNAPRISPDGRLVAYHTDNLNTNEVWVRLITSGTDAEAPPVSAGEGLGMVSWRDDGRELFYVSLDRQVVAVDVRTAPSLAVGEPRPIFEAPEAIPTAVGTFNSLGRVAHDGGRVAFAVPPPVPPPARNEIRVVDRTGRVVARPGAPGVHFGRPMLSPDGTKVAAGLSNLEANTSELWAFDLENDTSRRLVTDRDLGSWLWSPDGREVLYTSFADNAAVVYRLAVDGSGTPAFVYRHLAGTGFNLIDWSADGRFILFLSGGVLHVLPLGGNGEPVELIREEFGVGQALLSPDGRLLLYSTDEVADTEQAFIRTFDADAIALGPPSEKWQVSTDGSGGPHSWGRAGREVTYRHDGNVTAVALASSPTFSADAPQVLFRQPEGAGNASSSRNGERWAFYAPAVSAR